MRPDGVSTIEAGKQMPGRTKIFLQALANRLGYQIRRLDANVSLADAISEQVRLIGTQAKTVIEVGAADGRDAEQYARLFPNAQIIAIEPVPESFAKLALRADRTPRLSAINAALADAPGRSDFRVGAWVDASSLMAAKATHSNYDAYTKSTETIVVDTTTLDLLCAEFNLTSIDLLKMDVQGAELLALGGAQNQLRQRSIGAIYTEVQFTQCYHGAAVYHEIADLLAQQGFRLHNLFNMIHDHRGQLLWGDALFLHNEHHQQAA